VIRLRIKNHPVRPRFSLRPLLPRIKSHCLEQQLHSDSRDTDIKQHYAWVKKKSTVTTVDTLYNW
jgi:hypothetical protein